MMHTSMILETWLCCMCVWCIYPWCGNFVTSTLMHIYIMHVCIMHIHMLLDHVCTMYIHMLLDNDAYVHDAYICDIQSLTMLHVCMMRLKFCDGHTNQTTDKAILGVGCKICKFSKCTNVFIKPRNALGLLWKIQKSKCFPRI